MWEKRTYIEDELNIEEEVIVKGLWNIGCFDSKIEYFC